MTSRSQKVFDEFFDRAKAGEVCQLPSLLSTLMKEATNRDDILKTSVMRAKMMPERNKNSSVNLGSGKGLVLILGIQHCEDILFNHEIQLSPSDMVLTFKQLLETADSILQPSGYFLIFDRINLEWEATPLGVGIEHHDIVTIVNKSLINTKVHDRSSLERKRASDVISFGLNLTFSDVIHVMHKFGSHEHPTVESAITCQSQLNCIRSVLFKALDMTIETYTFDLPEHTPDFSKVIENLENSVYEHADDCMSHVYEIMNRYENSGKILSYEPKTASEGMKRVTLKRDLWKTIKEFQQAIQNYDGNMITDENFEEYLGKEEIISEKEERLLIFGPVRDFTAAETCNSEPSIFLAGVSERTTFEDLVNTYNFCCDMNAEERLDFSGLSFEEYCTEDHEHRPFCLAKSFFLFQEMNGLPQCFHLALKRKNVQRSENLVDQRDLDALVEFIEGDQEEKTSKKKVKKKKRKSNQPASEVVESRGTVLSEQPDTREESTTTSLPEPQCTNRVMDANADRVIDTNTDREINTDTDRVIDTNTDRVINTGDTDRVINTDTDGVTNTDGEWKTTRKKNKKGGSQRKISSSSESIVTQASSLRHSRPEVEPSPSAQSTKPKKRSDDIKSTGANNYPGSLPPPQQSHHNSIQNVDHRKSEIQSRLKSLESQLEETELAAVHVMNESHVRLNSVQKSIETCEERCHENSKKVAKADTDIEQLQKKLKELEAMKEDVMKDTEAGRKEVVKLKKKRIALENEVDSKMEPFKQRKADIGNEIQRAKEELIKLSLGAENSSNKSGSTEACDTSARSGLLLLEFLTSQIKAKESDLECPVCLETSHTPIYMCSEQHIICANCLRKVMSSRSECVECRTPYPSEPRRHRYMEKVAEELQDLRNKRREIIQSTTLNNI